SGWSIRSPSGVSNWTKSPARSGMSGAGWSMAGTAVVAAPDSTVTCHSFPGRDWDHQRRPYGRRFPDCAVSGRSRTLRARWGRTRPRCPWDAPHLTIYALIALEDTWRG